MQWSDASNAGFTSGTPWNPIPAIYKTYNVADELKDPDSILNWYKGLLALRRGNEALLDGEYLELNGDDPNVLSYLRKTSRDTVIVVINLSPARQTMNFDLTKKGLGDGTTRTLLTTQTSLKGNTTVKQISLEPFAVYIAEIKK
ncbi:MAG: alpha-glucosidase C-terminal domain-containing protein [Candidatus Acidiferrales bacterium]